MNKLIVPLLLATTFTQHIMCMDDPMPIVQHEHQKNPVKIINQPKESFKASYDLHIEPNLTPQNIRKHIHQGANPNYYWEKSYFPPVLLRAVEISYDSAALLLSFDANPNFTTAKDETPLSIAIKKQNVPIIELLLEYPVLDKCLPQAKATGNPEIIALVENALERDTFTYSKYLPQENKTISPEKNIEKEHDGALEIALSKAVETKNLATVRTLLAQKNITSSHLNAGLNMAVKIEDALFIELFVKAGADPIACLDSNPNAFGLLCQYIE